MTVHLIKLCVGVDEVAGLAGFQRDRLERHGRVWHMTRHKPRREAELLAGGSLYWVIRRRIQARQSLLGFEEAVDEEGTRRCRILLDPTLVETAPYPHRPFQGWRYLRPEDAPADRAGGSADDDMPEEMVVELRALGLL